jgi:tetratricopeptide (TPR) repeat protein
MACQNSLPILALALVSSSALCAQDEDAEGYLRTGVEPYRNENYLKAAEFFKEAVNAAPRKAAAHLYLGTAYSMAYQTSPNAAGADMARKASASFQRALELAPDNSVALASLGALAYAQAHRQETGLADARAWFEKAIAANPRDAVSLYFLAVIDSELAELIRKPAMTKAGFDAYYDVHPIGSKAVRADLQARVAPLYRSAIGHVRRALEIEPQFADALYCLGRLTILLADLSDTPAEYKRQTQGAQALFDKALSILKAGAQEDARTHPELSSPDMKITPAIVIPSGPAPPPPPPC